MIGQQAHCSVNRWTTIRRVRCNTIEMRSNKVFGVPKYRPLSTRILAFPSLGGAAKPQFLRPLHIRPASLKLESGKLDQAGPAGGRNHLLLICHLNKRKPCHLGMWRPYKTASPA